MNLFTKKTSSRNILVIGDKDSGKKSLIFGYKDGLVNTSFKIDRVNSITVKKTLEDKPTELVFTLNDASGDLVPSKSYDGKSYDLIVIVVDATDPDNKLTLKHYQEFCQRKYPETSVLPVLSKTDLIEDKEGELWLDVQTSAKTGKGLDVFASHIIEKLTSVEGDHSLAMK